MVLQFAKYLPIFYVPSLAYTINCIRFMLFFHELKQVKFGIGQTVQLHQ